MENFFDHMEEHEDVNMIKLEVNIDNISSEWLGYTMDKLLKEGANDVFYVPIFMKKNRPAYMMQVLCDQKILENIKRIIFEETTTLGIRYYPVTVHRLGRRFVERKTPWGVVKIKQGIYNGQIVQESPEYEDCKNIADRHQIPLKKIYDYVWKKGYKGKET
ncbi:nickel pincer cofactor biosynthesis protein LarC2 [Aeribacillus alveayuensis]|uniref:Uncharacterized protein (DUF111 family) n=1 Tax=Aeribacillus alveayuensis TaxID=279215 RepID=A0ABT9VN30_9BACI|nr:uncharacterized protein (DUF111 family) [Bacillus alveayuensis]